MLLILYTLALLKTLCSARIYGQIQDLPGREFDFVVVGGGTAGLVVANRLTENPHFSVLVLEAGGTSEGVLDSEVPFLFNNLLIEPNPHDWNYTTTPQPGLNGRVLPLTRAFMLGGCSAHNVMFYTRAAIDDWDRYAALTGDRGWSWKNVFPYFLKSEKWTPPLDNHDTSEQFNPAFHSTHGKVQVGLSSFAWPLGPRVINATKELAEDFPFNLDTNSGRPLGIGWVQSTIGRGIRSTSATAYLFPEDVQKRRNLHVLIGAQVSRLVESRKVGGLLTFGGVELVSAGLTSVVRARKEVILSAGPVGTPAILLRSGVGDPNDLRALGIPTLLPLPDVGRNVSDHPSVALSWIVNSTDTVERVTQNSTSFDAAFAEWNTTHGGPFSTTPSTNVGWLRLKDDDESLRQLGDPSAGPTAGHIELTFNAGISNVGSTTMTPGNHMAMSAVVVAPFSRGTIALNSTDPFAAPLINPNFLAHECDLYMLRYAVRKAVEFVDADAFRGYVVAPVVDVGAMADEELNTFIRNNTRSFAHICGSCGMSAPDAAYGVTNPDLRVKGTVGLRVIDASVLVRGLVWMEDWPVDDLMKPIVPSAHTQAAVYVIAERGADMLKGEYATRTIV
ncbi:hypothetical protein MKEN_00908500 [Mycena kentingensis (nom. inval.)]|nr:hypothetical protein MKEN_00908500 [Mycena kentingensis (nom. inval.)]